MKHVIISTLLCISYLLNANDQNAVADAIYNNDLFSVKTLIASKELANSTIPDEDNLSLLAYAAYLGNTEISTYLISIGADIMWQNKDCSVLHAAAYSGLTEIVINVLKADSSLCNLKDSKNYSPIVYAAEQDNLECVNQLLSYGANIELEEAFKRSLLNNHFEIAQLLLDKGVSKKGSIDDYRDSPLFEALLNNNLEAAEFLIKNGVNINAPLIINGKKSQNLFYNSLIRRNSDFAIFCLKNKTSFNEKLIISTYQATDTLSPFLYILKLKSLNNYNDWAQVADLLLKKASEKGLISLMLQNPEELFEYLTLKNNKTTLFDLLYYTNNGKELIKTAENKSISIIGYLNKSYPDTQINETLYISTEKDAFIRAIINGEKGTVKNMIRKDPSLLSSSVTFSLSNGAIISDKPFDCAVYSGQLNIAKYLYKKDNSYNGPSIHDKLFNSACQQNDTEMVKFLIKKNHNFQSQGKWHLYSNMDASPEIIDLFIKNGVDPDEYIFNGQSFLFYIVRTANQDAIDAFIDNSTAIDLSQQKLIKAIEYDRQKKVIKLLKKGADINYVSSSGLTPLCWAAYFRRYDIAKILIDNGANTSISERNYNSNPYPANGSSPLRWAINKGDTAIVGLLIKNNASPVIFLFQEENQNIFHYAARNNQPEIMHMLIDAYGNPPTSLKPVAGIDEEYLPYYYDYNATGIYRNLTATPFDVAAYNGYKDIWEQFIKLGLGVDNPTKPERNYYTPLFFAIGGKKPETVSDLIKLGADIKAPKTAEFLFSEAIQNGTPEIIDLLLSNGCANNLSDTIISISILSAANFQNSSVIKTLINNGADINYTSEDSINALMMIADSKRFADKLIGAEVLIKNGININQTDKNGISALHRTVKENLPEMVKLLLQKGANPNEVGNYNRTKKTPIDIVEYYDVYKELKKYGGIPYSYIEE